MTDIVQPDRAQVAEASLTPLAALRRGGVGVVVRVVDRNEGLGDEAQSTLARRLLELGFLEGERCEVVGETWPAGDPMAVRIGNSTFALRRREASAVLVRVNRGPDHPS